MLPTTQASILELRELNNKNTSSHNSKLPSPPSTPKFITLLDNSYEHDEDDHDASLYSTTSSSQDGEISPVVVAFEDEFIFTPKFLPLNALIPNFPVQSTSSCPSQVHGEKESTRKTFKKDDLVWVEIKEKLYLAQVVRHIKNVQVIINERSILMGEILGGQERQVEPSKCYHVDAPAMNNLERENLMWASPGCHSLAQVVSNWTNFVNKSFMDQLRSSQIFTMHFGKRNILLKNPDVTFINKKQASAIVNNGQDVVDYLHSQLSNGINQQCIVLLGEGSKEKQVTLQQVVMTLLNKKLLPYDTSNHREQEQYMDSIVSTVGPALNILLIFSNILYQKALTQTHMRTVTIKCDEDNRIHSLSIQSIFREGILCGENPHLVRNPPLYHIFLLMINAGESEYGKENHFISDDLKTYKLFQKHQVNYKDLNFLKMDVKKMKEYFSKFGISSQESDSIYRVLSACMWIYNFDFSSPLIEENEEIFEIVSYLLDLPIGQCRSIFNSQQQVNFIFDLLYGSVISFVESRINLQIQTILQNWRRRNEKTTSTQIKEIILFDLPTQTEANNLSDQFVELFNTIAVQSNAQNELNLIRDSLKIDNVQKLDQVMQRYESVNNFKTLDDPIFSSISSGKVDSTCELMKQSSSILKSIMGEEFVNNFGEDYLGNALERFENALFEELSSQFISRSYFIHCMTFAIEKKTSNAVFNQCLSQLKQSGFPLLMDLYSGDDKYGYKMKISDQDENLDESLDMVKGDNFIFLTDETILQNHSKLDARERNEFNKKLHFVTDSFEDVFSNRTISMFDIISPKTHLETRPIIDEEIDFLDQSEEDEFCTDNSFNILEMDINVDNMTDEEFTFEIPPRDMLYHAACYGLSSFAHVQTKMMDPSSLRHTKLMEESLMSIREYMSKFRNSDCSTSFSFDKDQDSIDFRDTKDKNESNFSKKLMSRKELKVLNVLNLENLKPDFSIFSKSLEIVSNSSLKRLFQSLSEQFSDYDNSYVLQVREKQIKELVTFTADYWFTFLKDEKNVVSFIFEKNGKTMDPIPIILESVKLLNFACVYSRQKEEIVKIVREEGLLNMLCEMVVRVHSDRQGKGVNLKELRSSYFIELEQLSLMTILSCVKKDKQACGYLSHEEYFWNFFKCLVCQIKQFNDMIEANSTSTDMKNITEIFANSYMEILASMISDQYSYQFLKFQTSEIVSSSKISNITKTIVHNIKNNNIDLLLNPDFYNKIIKELVFILQNFDKKSMRVNDFVSVMQNVIPFFSYNQNHLRELIHEWISQIEFRSAFFSCQCLRSLSKIFEKLRGEPTSAFSSFKKMILSNRYKDVISIALENNLLPIVKTKISDLVDERNILNEEKRKNHSKIQEVSNSLENIVFAVVYLAALYENFRKQLVRFIFSENRVRMESMEKESFKELQLNDVSNKNVENMMKGLSENANSEYFNQFSDKFINHWIHMSPITNEKIQNNNKLNQTLQSLNQSSTSDKRKSMFSIESLLNQSHSLNSSTLSQMNTSRQQLLSVYH